MSCAHATIASRLAVSLTAAVVLRVVFEGSRRPPPPPLALPRVPLSPITTYIFGMHEVQLGYRRYHFLKIHAFVFPSYYYRETDFKS